MGWNRKVLRVNLTAGTCKSEPLNMKWADEYLGSRGLSAKYLISEIDPKVDPLSPDNKMIMATGPLTGTMASTGGRYGRSSGRSRPNSGRTGCATRSMRSSSKVSAPTVSNRAPRPTASP